MIIWSRILIRIINSSNLPPPPATKWKGSRGGNRERQARPRGWRYTVPSYSSPSLPHPICFLRVLSLLFFPFLLFPILIFVVFLHLSFSILSLSLIFLITSSRFCPYVSFLSSVSSLFHLSTPFLSLFPRPLFSPLHTAVSFFSPFSLFTLLLPFHFFFPLCPFPSARPSTPCPLPRLL